MTETKTPIIPIDPKMLRVLVCPKSRGPLIHDSETNELISKKAGLAYPIRDGVPILLVERARAL
ncbi:MAG: Trm112 family protein [Litorimonas sp.]